MKKYDDVTLVITSCGRFDLLERTVRSIPEFILNNLHDKIIIDDSGDSSFLNKIANTNLFNNFTKIINHENIGQPKSVDRVYSLVKTKYSFHCEDDWLFQVDYDFITQSINLLELHPKLLQVTFVKNAPHPTVTSIISGVEIKVPGWRNEWYGFTYNPSIINLKNKNIIKNYSGMREQDIGFSYYKEGCLTASIRGVATHIGDGRTTNSYIKL